MLSLADQWGAPPDYGPEARAALHAWDFLGGWAPERLPLYAVLYPLPDPELMVELLMAIRNTTRGAHG